MARNLTPYQLNAASVAARNAEYGGDPLTDLVGGGTYADPYLGMNRAGSNAPGIGINTGNIYQSAAELAIGEIFSGWTELDQDEAARIPQDSQHLGGDGLGDGDQSVNPINLILGQNTASEDFNDTANLVIADVAAVDGAEMDTVSGAVNQTGITVGIGDLIWGNVPVV